MTDKQIKFAKFPTFATKPLSSKKKKSTTQKDYLDQMTLWEDTITNNQQFAVNPTKIFDPSSIAKVSHLSTCNISL